MANVSSTGDRIGLPLCPAYQGTKYAFEGVSESMLFETDLSGIKVHFIEAGTIEINLVSNAIVGQKGCRAQHTIAPKLQTMQEDWGRILDQDIPPEEVAKMIL